jgi:hypothetical protein
MIRNQFLHLKRSKAIFCHGLSGNASFTKDSFLFTLSSTQLGQFRTKFSICVAKPNYQTD